MHAKVGRVFNLSAGFVNREWARRNANRNDLVETVAFHPVPSEIHDFECVGCEKFA